MIATIIAIAAFVTGLLLCSRILEVVVPYLRREGVMDEPNQRSSHLVPTPRGGGLAIGAIVIPALLLAGLVASDLPWKSLALGYMALAYCSWRDDHGGLSPGVRLLVQSAAVAITLAGLGSDSISGLPVPLLVDRIVIGLAWIWFINLYNFMDGIDGIAGVEAVSIAVGVGTLVVLDIVPTVPIWVPATVAGAAAGFLRWNWSPARVFMGDVGSVPIGYTLGFLLVLLAREGAQPAALILPLYFVCDATITLLRRVVAGKKPWQAHREHFYQKAVTAGRGHAEVAADVAVTNLALVIIAVASIFWGWPAVVPACICVGLLIRRWQRSKS